MIIQLFDAWTNLHNASTDKILSLLSTKCVWCMIYNTQRTMSSSRFIYLTIRNHKKSDNRFAIFTDKLAILFKSLYENTTFKAAICLAFLLHSFLNNIVDNLNIKNSHTTIHDSPSNPSNPSNPSIRQPLRPSNGECS